MERRKGKGRWEEGELVLGVLLKGKVLEGVWEGVGIRRMSEGRIGACGGWTKRGWTEGGYHKTIE